VEHEVERGTVQLQSISRSLNSIRACLRYASEKFEDLKAWRVPKKPLKASDCDKHRERPLEEEEIVSIAKAFASNPEYTDALHFLAITLGTASRMDELLSLRWQDVNFKKRTIKLFASKTQKEKNLQLEAVVDVIESRKEMGLGDDVFVFTCRDHWVRKAFEDAAGACGIPYGQKNVNGDIKGFTPHDLRGTALTALLNAGIDLATVSKEYAAHTDLKLTARYLNPTRKSKQLAASAANNLVGLVSQVEVDGQE
jgi:integrase